MRVYLSERKKENEREKNRVNYYREVRTKTKNKKEEERRTVRLLGASMVGSVSMHTDRP